MSPIYINIRSPFVMKLVSSAPKALDLAVGQRLPSKSMQVASVASTYSIGLRGLAGEGFDTCNMSLDPPSFRRGLSIFAATRK